MDDAGALITAVRWIPRGLLQYTPDSSTVVDQLRGLASEVATREATLAAITPEKRSMEDAEVAEIQEFRGSNIFSIDAELSIIVKDKNLRLEFLKDDPELKNEIEAETVLPTDCPLIVCRVEEQMSQALLYIHVHEVSGLYVHHTIELPSKPLCCEFLQASAVSLDQGLTYTPEEGAFAAFGYMHFGFIEVFDLRDPDEGIPILVLGEMPAAPTKKGKLTKPKRKVLEGHTAAVICMKKNPFNHWILATGSADLTVRVWDVSVPKTLAVMRHHSKPIQALAWHPQESQVLASGGFDHCVVVVDCAELDQIVSKFVLDGAVEALWWDRWDHDLLWAADSTGRLSCLDRRQNTIVHKGNPADLTDADEEGDGRQAMTGIAQSFKIRGLTVTTMMNGRLHVWDTRNPSEGVKLVFTKDFTRGPLCSVDASPDEATLFAVGATDVIVWDAGAFNDVNYAFGLELEVGSPEPIEEDEAPDEDEHGDGMEDDSM